MKVYISGPITGTIGYMEKFAAAEEALVAAGHTVINPARVNAQLPETTTHAEYMAVSITLLEMCDTIFMLKGWKQSKGANIEFEYAYQHDFTIVFEGGRECRKASRPERESSRKKPEKKSMRETWASVFSAKQDGAQKEQPGLI